jgi:CO/xanthine dehydrogenase FAD-binding subunit
MLINLRAIHKPPTVADAIRLLRQGAHPIYGGGAALIRANDNRSEEALDLTNIVPAQCHVKGRDMFLGGRATLQQISEFDPALGDFVAADLPLTLRNAYTLGDLLLECPPTSLFLGLLHGLVARIDTPDRGETDVIEINRWFELGAESRRAHIILGVLIPDFPATKWHFAFEKISRTPADQTLVGAIGFAYPGDPDPGSYSVVVGGTPQPVRYQAGMKAEIEDYKGSIDYRTAMMKVASERAIAKAEAKAG